MLNEIIAYAHSFFSEWLAGAEDNRYNYTDQYGNLTIIRVQKNENFYYLYAQPQYYSDRLFRGRCFDYVGIYCTLDGRVYDDQYAIRKLVQDSDIMGGSQEMLKTALKKAVRQAVEVIINNNTRNNLFITELSDEEELHRSLKQSAAGVARAAYLKSNDNDFDFSFRCTYSPEEWSEDSLLAYILDPIKYAEKETADYITNHQSDMLSSFLRADMALSEYAAILENPLNPVHRVKLIMQAVAASTAKTVKVTIFKANIVFSFKAGADEFHRDCGRYYRTWRIVAADRREFEKLFNHEYGYRPEEILRIEYNRSILYEAPEAATVLLNK